MKNIRGQLTVFIIFALVILLFVLVYFAVFKGNGISFEKSASSDSIYKYAEQCIQDSALDTAAAFGYQQGYYNVPGKNSLETGIYRIAYYYLNGEVLIPDNKFFEGEFSKILDDKIAEKCGDFPPFAEDNYFIVSGNATSGAKISDNNVLLNVNYPVTITDNGTSTSFSEFTYTLPVRIGHILDVSRTLVNEIKKDPDSIDLTFFLNQDLEISVSNYDDCNQVYILLDNGSISKEGDPYAFSFAAGFSGENCQDQS